MTSRISQRISSIAESATLKVDSRAKALQAAGRPVISFAAGEPDFATPDYVVEAAVAAARDPKNHRYTPAAGLPELREAIVEKTLRDSGLVVSPAQIVVTNGGKQAVYQAFATLLDPGDEVLLLVSPSNPTGAVYSPEQTRAIGEWALEHGIWVISDEIYQNLTYPSTGSGQATATRAVSIVEAVPALADTTILVNGVAKTYAMTGWRVGWMVGPADAIKAAANLQSHLSSNVSNVSQRAALAALRGPQETVQRMLEAFDRRRRLLVDGLSAIDGVVCPTPEGAFYVYPDVTGLLHREWGGVTPTTSLQLADLILEQAEVAAVPGEAFGPSGYLRFSYTLGDDQLLEGVRRLQALVV